MLFFAFLLGCWFGGCVYALAAISLFRSTGTGGGLTLFNIAIVAGWPVVVFYMAWTARNSVVDISVRESKK